MNSVTPTPYRFLFVLIISLLLVSGCSSSSDSSSSESQAASDLSGTNGNGVASVEGTADVTNEIEDVTTDDTSSSTQDESNDVAGESTTGSGTESATESSETPTTTSVNFDITVPVFMSEALQVRLVWGDIDTTAIWNRDELWTASLDFPTNTTNQLVVTFSDGNGETTLGSVERSFTTGANSSESFQIAADEFDTDRWDSDGDGVSNLDELIAGATLSGEELLEPTQARLELIQDKTFRISWQPSEGADFYRVLENSDGISGFSPISDELGPAVQTFDHRVALYKRFNASYIVQACSVSGCVDSAEQLVTGTLEQAIGYFKASNTEFEDFFGDTVSLSSDGNTLVVGASGRFGLSPGGGESDAVYVFQRSDGNWVTQAVLRSNTDDGFAAGFGKDISLSSDGNTLAVGATGENIVYVFIRTDGSWLQQALIETSNAEPGDGFGAAVSLDAEGNILVASAPFESSSATGVNGDQSDNSARSAGAVYVFERSDGAWQQQAYLKASNTEASDIFGGDVSLSPDGSTIAVAAATEDSAATGVNGDQGDNSAVNAGAVYVFVASDETWQQQAYLKASNTRRSNSFGSALSLSFEGDTLAVGSAFFDNNRDDSLFEAQGAVYTFTRTIDVWQQEAFLQASNADSVEFFGTSISLSASGNTLAVGAPEEDSQATGVNGSQITGLPLSQGAVYMFSRSDAVWQQQAYLKAGNTDRGQFFGQAVSLSLDGHTLAAGAHREASAATGVNGDQNDNSAPFAGAVYLY